MTASATLLAGDDRAALAARFDERVRFDTPLAPATWWKIGGPGRRDDRRDERGRRCIRAAMVFQGASCRASCWRRFEFTRRRRRHARSRGAAWRFVRRARRAYRRRRGRRARRRERDAAATRSQAASLGALGVDGLAGIPATVGGALRMNAVPTARSASSYATCACRPRRSPARVDLGRVLVPPNHAAAGRDRGRRTLAFECGDPAAVRARTQDRLVRRKATQPVAVPNAGSCFRNPPGDQAGRLIEAAGPRAGARAGRKSPRSTLTSLSTSAARRPSMSARSSPAFTARSMTRSHRPPPRSSPRRGVRSGCLKYGSRW